MSEREFERRTGPRFTFGDRRGPATPYPGIVDGSSDFGAGSLLAEHRGSLADAEADAVHRWIAPAVAGKHVLDVGCGAGHGAEILRDAGAETVVGTDPDPREIEVATRQYGHEAGLRFVTAPPAALPLASGSFDVVLCAETLDSVALETALPELRRVLKADGVLVVSLPLDAARDEIDGSELRPAIDAERWLELEPLAFANRRVMRRCASLAASILDPDAEDGLDPAAVSWLGSDPAEDNAVLLAASDAELPDLPATASLIGARDLRSYRLTIAAWEQRARKAEADGAAKHWELVASREAQRRLRKRLWILEHRPLRRLFRLFTGQPWKLSEGPQIRPPERPPEPWR